MSNRGQRARSCFEEALHSYFCVADVERASRARSCKAQATPTKCEAWRGSARAAPELTLSAETDRVYDSAETCTIRDLEAGRALQIEKADSGATVVWNPWSEKAAQMSDLGADAWPRMLCVESANVGTSRITARAGRLAHSARRRVSACNLRAGARTIF